MFNELISTKIYEGTLCYVANNNDLFLIAEYNDYGNTYLYYKEDAVDKLSEYGLTLADLLYSEVVYTENVYQCHNIKVYWLPA